MPAQSIVLKTNETGLIKGLESAFTEKINLIAELLQNARRAGATCVRLEISDGTLTVEDDGSGIRNFQDLLTIAGSGWTAATRSTESPYGLGFMAALFGAEHIRVESGTTAFEADTSTLLERKPVGLVQCDPVTGARITLRGVPTHRNGLDYMTHRIEQLVRGFPIDVIVNGRSMERPHAEQQDSDDWIDLPIGRLRGSYVATHEFPLCYLQGLPIRTSRMDRRLVVHLDPTRFTGRFPDRDVLVDETERVPEIEEAVAQGMKDWLARRASRMKTAPTDEQLRFVRTCWGWDVPELTNDIRVVPADVFLDPDDAMNRTIDDTFTMGHDQPVTEERIGSAPVLMPTLWGYGEERGYAPMLYASAFTTWILDENAFLRLPVNHWLRRRTKEVGKEITISVEDLEGTADFDTEDEGPVTVKACKAFTLSDPSCGTCQFTDRALFADGEILMPCYDDAVTTQVGSYKEHDIYREDWHDEAIEALRLAYAKACGETPASQLAIRLNRMLLLTDTESFHGKRVLLTFDKIGRVTADLVPDPSSGPEAA